MEVKMNFPKTFMQGGREENRFHRNPKCEENTVSFNADLPVDELESQKLEYQFLRQGVEWFFFHLPDPVDKAFGKLKA